MTWFFTAETELGTMRCHPLTPERFPDMETVFGERGVARKCFCMHWRRPNGGFPDRADNRDRFAELTDQGPAPGVLGYVEDSPVGWVQVGPRDLFPTIERSRALKPVDDVETWSINCFVVRVGHRRQGVGTGLLGSAIDFAKCQGARVLEAYPVDGERASAVDLFTGTLGMFAEHGFAEIVRRTHDRPIVRLELA